MKRKVLPKSIRFEIFKRDSFTCQYCGRSSPDVILECDHIVPVSEGGTDDVLNLVTSCRDCNRGKGKRKLSDMQVIDKQKQQLKDLNEIREQTEMMIQWKKELVNLQNEQIDFIDSLICEDGSSLTANGKRDIGKLISRFGFDEVCIASEIAFDRYYLGTESTWEKAFRKIGGICYNRANGIKTGGKN